MKKLRIKPWFHSVNLAPEGVYLLAERGHAVVKGELSCRLAELLDGTRDAEEIARIVESPASPAEVFYLLEMMKRNGFIEEVEPEGHPSHEALRLLLNLDSDQAASLAVATQVSIRSIGGVPVQPLLSALAEMAIAVTENGSFSIVLTNDYLQPELRRVNRDALNSGQPWMLLKPVGTIIWLGPVFWPGNSACWECMAQRIAGNREVERYLQQRIGTDVPFPTSRITLPATLQVAMRLAALVAAQWLAKPLAEKSSTKLVTLDTLSLELDHHTIVRQPQCPACGWMDSAPGRHPVAVSLGSRKRLLSSDGGHRSVPPDETIRAYSHHISPYVGAVTHLERVPSADDQLMHVYSAGHNFAVRRRNLNSLRRGLRSNAAGKGSSGAQAKASALCEALERYSGMFRGDEIRMPAKYRQLGGDAIPPNDCMLFSHRQYEQREVWNARDSNFQVVPLAFDEDVRIEWSPVWSLTEKRFRYLPTAYLYFGYPSEHHNYFCWADSNGNAAGNNLEEAVLQGFLELAERDSVSLWWYNRARRPSVDLDSFDDPYIASVCKKYTELNRPLWVLDLTTDLQIPSFAAVSRRTDKPVEDILIAFGAHLDPRIGVRRAVTELNQFLPAVLPMASDGTGEYAFPDPESQEWWRTATTLNQPYLLPDSAQSARKLSDYPMYRGDDLHDDIDMCRSIVERLGMQMLVLDQTRPDVGLPAVKVLVPGLRHFWARFAPGRLYDVPPKLGWLAEPVPEDLLNPIPVFV